MESRRVFLCFLLLDLVRSRYFFEGVSELFRSRIKISVEECRLINQWRGGLLFYDSPSCYATLGSSLLPATTGRKACWMVSLQWLQHLQRLWTRCSFIHSIMENSDLFCVWKHGLWSWSHPISSQCFTAPFPTFLFSHFSWCTQHVHSGCCFLVVHSAIDLSMRISFQARVN